MIGLDFIEEFSYEQIFHVCLIILITLTSFYFLNSTFFLSRNSYGGLSSFMTSIFYISLSYFAYKCLKNEISRVSYGLLLGLFFLLIFISMQDAIFWGQYSLCESFPFSLSSTKKLYGVECSHTGAMIFGSILSLLISFLSLIFSFFLIKFKDDILYYISDHPFSHKDMKNPTQFMNSSSLPSYQQYNPDSENGILLSNIYNNSIDSSQLNS